MNNGTDNKSNKMTHSAEFVGVLRTTLNIFGKGLSEAFIGSRVISRYRDVCNKYCFIYLRYNFAKRHNTHVESNGKMEQFVDAIYAIKSNQENMTQFDR